MPVVKNARLRHRIIEERIRNPYRPFPNIDELREACEEKLFGSVDGANISKSTIEKDIREMKEEYDAPIAFSRQEKGYYFTDPDYSSDAIPFTSEDAESLRFAAMTLNQYRQVPIFGQFQHAIGKIFDRVMISDKMDDETIGQVVQFEAEPKVGGSQWLNPLFQAIKNRVEVELTYHSYSSAQVKSYTIHPYLLKEYRKRWYVIAFRPDKQQIGTFELGRVQQLEAGRTEFQIEASFNPDDFFKYAFGVTVLKGKPQQVVLEFDNSEMRYILDTPLHHSQKMVKEGKSSTQVSLEVYLTTELVMSILSYGKMVKVISPDELATTVASGR